MASSSASQTVATASEGMRQSPRGDKEPPDVSRLQQMKTGALLSFACEAGAVGSALQGLDGLIFTAGIGENSPAIREAICARLGWLGIRLDAAANAKGANRISAADSEVEVRVMATDEEAVIAKHTQDLLRRERC